MPRIYAAVRLNAYLARAGVASRRKADELIKAGRVTVNGEPGQLNTFVQARDRVAVDGEPVAAQQLTYVLLPGTGPDRADAPRGPQPTGEADARCGRPSGAPPAPQPLRGPDGRRARARRVARARALRSRSAAFLERPS